MMMMMIGSILFRVNGINWPDNNNNNDNDEYNSNDDDDDDGV